MAHREVKGLQNIQLSVHESDVCVNETELQYNYLLGLLCSILRLCLFLGCPETTDIFQYLTAKNVISYNPVLKDTEMLKGTTDTEKLTGTTVFVIISKQLHYATNIHFNTDNQSSDTEVYCTVLTKYW